MCALFAIIALELYEAQKLPDKAAQRKRLFQYLLRTFLVCCLIVFLARHPRVTWDEALDPYVTPEMVQSVTTLASWGAWGFQMPISTVIPVFDIRLHITDISYSHDFEELRTWVSYDRYGFIGPIYYSGIQNEGPSGLPAIPLPEGGVHS